MKKQTLPKLEEALWVLQGEHKKQVNVPSVFHAS
jgi:hypothetical protein